MPCDKVRTSWDAISSCSSNKSAVSVINEGLLRAKHGAINKPSSDDSTAEHPFPHCLRRKISVTFYCKRQLN